jgi:hypothetical protein
MHPIPPWPRILPCLALAGSLFAADMASDPSDQKSRAALLAGHTPILACTPEELNRLKTALAGSGAEREAVARVLSEADAFLAMELLFPPRGGQHNQHYQCEPCQLGLETVDETHHRCPGCGKVYTGEPYDDVIFAKRHRANLQGLLDCAWAWTLTGHTNYADRAREVLLGYAARYTNYPYHDNLGRTGREAALSGGHLNEQTLGEAGMMATQIAPAYDLVRAALSDADRAAILDGLIRPMLQNIAKCKRGKSNWQSWHNAALFAGGLLADSPEWVRFSMDDPAHGFQAQLRASVTADGMWYENSWGYHFYTLSALTLHAEYARRNGYDLWKQPMLRRMFLLPAAYVMPDGSLPRFGDDPGTLVRNPRFTENLDHAFAATREPGLIPLLSDSPAWASVLHGRAPEPAGPVPAPACALFPAAGHAILRSGGPARLAAVLTFGPYGGFHGHLDKLSFVFFGHGRELGVDPGRAKSQAYRLPIHTEWYKATLGHNTVLVDGKSQDPAAGRLLLFQPDSDLALAAAECDAAYPGVTHARLLALAPEYLLVLDRLRSEKKHAFEWVYHNRGSAFRCEPEPAQSAAPAPPHVKDLREGRTRGEIRAVFVDDPVDTHLLLAGPGDTRVRTGHGPFGNVLERVPLILAERAGTQVVFAAALEPVLKPAASALAGLEVREDNGLLRVAVRVAGRTDTMTWDGGTNASTRRGD